MARNYRIPTQTPTTQATPPSPRDSYQSHRQCHIQHTPSLQNISLLTMHTNLRTSIPILRTRHCQHVPSPNSSCTWGHKTPWPRRGRQQAETRSRDVQCRPISSPPMEPGAEKASVLRIMEIRSLRCSGRQVAGIRRWLARTPM